MPYFSTNNIIKEVFENKNYRYLYNSHRTFKFKNNCFYSYNTVIAEFTNNDYDNLFIHKKTAILGEFISYTTSKQVNFLIEACRKYNINNNINNPKIIFFELKYVDEPIQCPIILEDVNDIIETPCGHKFSQDAFHEWLKENSNCPLCRTKF